MSAPMHGTTDVDTGVTSGPDRRQAASDAELIYASIGRIAMYIEAELAELPTGEVTAVLENLMFQMRRCAGLRAVADPATTLAVVSSLLV